MTISDKDIKILWGKAAGRCSICRDTLFHAADNPSDTTLIGENCHIVAEKQDGPRGQSNLNSSDRNRYPNLILLCRNHHKIIDDDETTYSIEVLYQIKTDHELWIENSFVSNGNPEKDYYIKFVNEISLNLKLSNWEAISDHLIRFLMPVFFEEAVNELKAKVFKAHWPNKYPVLEEKIINLSSRASEFVDCFCSNGVVKDDFWHENQSWKSKGWLLNFHEYAEEVEIWQKNCSDLLLNLVHALNEFSDQVRENIDSSFFRYEGKFVILDSLGVTKELREARYLPDRYIDVTITPITIIPIYEKK